MTRLIDADALIEDIRKHSESYFADDFAHEWVDHQPTVDAIPIEWILNHKRMPKKGPRRRAILDMIADWAERKSE